MKSSILCCVLCAALVGLLGLGDVAQRTAQGQVDGSNEGAAVGVAKALGGFDDSLDLASSPANKPKTGSQPGDSAFRRTIPSNAKDNSDQPFADLFPDEQSPEQPLRSVQPQPNTRYGMPTISSSLPARQHPSVPRYAPSPSVIAASKIRSGAKKLLAAKTDSARAEAKKELSLSLDQYFEEDMKTREAEIAKIEKRVNKLRAQLDKRRAAKTQIVQLQLKVLVNEANGLGFYSKPTKRSSTNQAGFPILNGTTFRAGQIINSSAGSISLPCIVPSANPTVPTPSAP